MRCFAQCLRGMAAGFLGIALVSMPAVAEQAKTVGGFIVNFGLVPAELALGAEGHRESHQANPPPGSQHLLITLDEEKSGKRIGDAEVVIEVTDPKGHKEKKPLLHTQAVGCSGLQRAFQIRRVRRVFDPRDHHAAAGREADRNAVHHQARRLKRSSLLSAAAN
jgi:hypothetical protein